MKQTNRTLLILIMITLAPSMQGVVVGSTSVPSVQGLTTFAGASNVMLGFAAFTGGVTLTNAATFCQFNDFFPVSGPVTMNNGLFNLFQPLILGSSATLINGGSINGNGYGLTFPLATSFSIPGNLVLGNTTVQASSNITLTSLITFTNTTVFDGGGYTINITSGSLAVGSGASLMIQNATLRGLNGNNLYCYDNVGSLTLNNVTCIETENFTFTLGNLVILDEVVVTGTFLFTYRSTKALTISSNSTLFFDSGMTFSYDTSANNLLTFSNNTSVLHLYETTLFANTHGLILQLGEVVIDGLCPLISAGTTSAFGISIGNGVSAANNLTLKILAESGLSLQSGFFVDNNV